MRNPTLDALLDLDGQVLVVDPEGGHRVRLMVTRVPVSPMKPHGIDDALTLPGSDGERLVGFDNAHPVARQKRYRATSPPGERTTSLGRHEFNRRSPES